VIFGALVDDDIQDEVSITVLATGFSQDAGYDGSGSDMPDFLGGR
jgi:cell division GTPase FtsZ